MVPIENSVEGGVTATLDAIATGTELRIIREALVPITLRAGCPSWREDLGHPSDLDAWPCLGPVPAVGRRKYARMRNTCPAPPRRRRAVGLLEERVALRRRHLRPHRGGRAARAWTCLPRTSATTRARLPASSWSAGRVRCRTAPARTRPRVVVPLPEDRPGALMEILDQFATRGVNLSRIESRPTGQYLGHYFFSIDADGHACGRPRSRCPGRACTGSAPPPASWGPTPVPTRRSPQVAPHTSDAAFAGRACLGSGHSGWGISRARACPAGFAHSVGIIDSSTPIARIHCNAYACLIHIVDAGP